MAIRVIDVDESGYDPPDTVEPLCDWPIIMDCDPSTAFTDDVVERAMNLAADIMNAATARFYGVCLETFAPNPPRCTGPGHSDGWPLVNPRIGSFAGAQRFGEFYYGITDCNGCGWYGCCDCQLNTKIKLWHHRVIDIQRILIDGVILDPDAYHLRGNVLIRDDGDSWPTTQADLPMGDEGTWYICYRHGIPLPQQGQVATGILACEIALALSGSDDCSLPERTRVYTNHAGLTIGFLDPMEFLTDGLTGLEVPDYWISRVNPKHLTRRARAYSYYRRQRGAVRVANPSDLSGGLPAVYTGDINQEVIIRLDGIDNLDTATAVEGHVWVDPDTVTVLSGIVEDSEARTVRINLGGPGGWLPTLVQDVAQLVVYNLQVQVTFSDPAELTWPSDPLPVIGQAA